MSDIRYRMAVTYYSGSCPIDGIHESHQWVSGVDTAGNVLVRYCAGQYSYCPNCGDGSRLQDDQMCTECEGVPPFDVYQVVVDLFKANAEDRLLGQ